MRGQKRAGSLVCLTTARLFPTTEYPVIMLHATDKKQGFQVRYFRKEVMKNGFER